MYPNEIIFGLDLYGIMIALGIILCMLTYRKLADLALFEARLQNFTLFTTIFSVALGYGSAVLTQAFYNMMKTGVFKIANDTGATFYGGLIGGAATFILIYFVVGRFVFKDGYHKRMFVATSDIAAVSITLAHAFGRLGCFFAGCCHGKPTTAWYGVTMNGVKVVPTQLFESAFLFVLFGLLLLRYLDGKSKLLPTYMVSYGVWRFAIEFSRGDERGATIVPFLSPSQLTAIILIIGGIVLYFIYKKLEKRHGNMIASVPENAKKQKNARAEEKARKEAEFYGDTDDDDDDTVDVDTDENVVEDVSDNNTNGSSDSQESSEADD